jgi:hypothetical protein
MQTNLIPITIKAPALSPKNIKSILNRIRELHPRLDSNGSKQYLCDLLNIRKLSEIESEFLLHQEISPAVTSKQLHQLAQRILPFNDNDVDKSVFSARNILNTTPSKLDDLIDYSTQERKQSFISDMMNGTLVGLQNRDKKVGTIDELAVLMKEEITTVIDVVCGDMMDECQKLPLDCKPGLTYRQQMLYSAADYYFNHRMGYQCNSIWLACFLSSEMFGCSSGWTHRNGDLCNTLHFGFKDDTALPILVEQSSEYTQKILESALENVIKEGDTGKFGNVPYMYISTLIFTLGILVKDTVSNQTDHSASYNAICKTLEKFDSLQGTEHRLMIHTLDSVVGDYLGFTEEYYEAFESFIINTKEEPQKHLLHYFDAWNFHNFDVQFLHTGTLAAMFIKAKYEPNLLEKFSEIILQQIRNDEHKGTFDGLFKGFFDNYLHLLVNENSDNHFMYDSILRVALSAQGEVDTSHIVQTMAELGHKNSIIAFSLSKSGDEEHYWNKRLLTQ